MAMTTHSLGRSYLHNDELPRMLHLMEGFQQGVYDDLAAAHYPTIGIGLMLRNDTNVVLMLDYLGVFAVSDAKIAQEVLNNQRPPETHEETVARYWNLVSDFSAVIATHTLSRTPGDPPGGSASEQLLQQDLDSMLALHGVQGTFAIANENDAKALKIKYITGYTVGPFPTPLPQYTFISKYFSTAGAQAELDTILANNGTVISHDTREYKALMSLYFNNPDLIGTGLKLALGAGDRAEAWLQIRYYSNGGTPSNGIAKRRYWESEVFGLYDNRDDVGHEEAMAVYRTFCLRRADVMPRETQYHAMVAAANTDYQGADVHDLQASLDPARDAVIEDFNSSHLESTVAQWSYLSTDIYVDPGRAAITDSVDQNRDWQFDSRTVTTTRNVVILGEGGTDTLTSGNGNDILIGGDGSDTLVASGGDDVLDGLGSEQDVLMGGKGNDTYFVEGDDIVIDEDGQGVIYAGPNHILLGGGSRDHDERIFRGNDSRVTYEEAADGTIIAHVQGVGRIVISAPGHSARGRGAQGGGGAVVSGLPGLGISLLTRPEDDPDEPDDGDLPRGPLEDAKRQASPIVLDLNSDGISTIGISRGAYFDYDGNGFAQQTAWINPEDAFLVHDLNGDGNINSGRELFGDDTLLASGQAAKDGYEAMAALDSNQDGVLDASDAAWSQLQVWRDADSDGYADSGELLSLTSVGVRSIAVTASAGSGVDSHGNDHRLQSSFTRIDGTVGQTTDIWFREHAAASLQEELLPLSTEVAALPELRGSGNVYDLRQAMMRDTSGALVGLVTQFANEQNREVRRTLLDQILLRWTNSQGIDPMSRGGNVDARELNAVEQFFAEDFLQLGSAPDPRVNAGALLGLTFDRIGDRYYGQLLAQTHMAELFQAIALRWDDATQAFSGDLSAVLPLLGQRLSQNHEAGKEFLAEFLLSMRAVYDVRIFDTAAFLTALESYGADVAVVAEMAWRGLIATAHGDQLNGDDTSETIDGLGGADAIFGSGGNDHLSGGEGDDQLEGELGNDTLDGGEGTDTLNGGDGADTFLFGLGDGSDAINNDDTESSDDVVRFGAGILPGSLQLQRLNNDVIISVPNTDDSLYLSGYLDVDGEHGGGIDRFEFADGTVWTYATVRNLLIPVGTGGDDYLYGFADGETLSGLGGADRLFALGGNDTLNGGSGNDYLYGGAGDDIVRGGSGADVIFDESGNDTYRFYLGDQSDYIYDYGADSADVLSFGVGIAATDISLLVEYDDLILRHTNGTDEVVISSWFESSEGDYQIETVQFADGTQWNASQVTTNALALAGIGTSGNDDIIGVSGYGNTLLGYAGADSLAGGLKDDVLDGGAGADTLSGGAGSDTYIHRLGEGADVIRDYSGPTDTNRLAFQAGINAAAISIGADGDDLVLRHGNGLDVVTVQRWFQFASDQPLVEVTFADGTAWTAASITATAVALPVVGTAGNDTLGGKSAYADVMDGLGGNDMLYAGGGDDVLRGGAGSDELEGGEGADVYQFELGDGADTIIDYAEFEQDNVLQFGVGISANDISARSVGDDLVLRHANGADRVTVSGWFSSGTADFPLSEVRFANGTVWTAQSITASVLALPVSGTGGADALNGRSRYSTTLRGLGGADTLSGGEQADILEGGSGADVLYAWSGNDVLDGGTGNDTLRGEDGDDQYIFNLGYGHDVIYDTHWGAGGDILKFGASVLATDISIAATGDDLVLRHANGTDSVTVANWFAEGSGVYQLHQVEFNDGTIWSQQQITDVIVGVPQVGTAANDVLTGTNGYADALRGEGGNDTLSSGAGDDVLAGGTGSDILNGGSGNDEYLFSAGDGADRIVDAGWIEGEADFLRLNGIQQSDMLITRNGWDVVLRHVNGTDSITFDSLLSSYALGVQSSSVLFADAAISGSHLLSVASSAEIVGSSGADGLHGTDASDTYLFQRGCGQDEIFEVDATGAATDVIRFAPGIAPGEIEVWRDAADLHFDLIGSTDGISVRSFFFDNGACIERVEFSDGTVWGESTFAAAKYMGTESSDYIEGNEADNLVYGQGGPDYIYGYAGSDLLDGGSGDDSIDGGEGNDQLFGGAGGDTINGDAGADTLSGDSGDDILDGGAAGDVYVFAAGFDQDVIMESNATSGAVDVVRFAAGITPASVLMHRDASNLYLRVGSDTVTVQSFFDATASQVERVEFADGTIWDHAALLAAQFIGTPDADYFSGSSQNDVMYGLGGTDTLDGGAGTDTLDGGTGNDTLIGGEGDDELLGQEGADWLTGDGGNDLFNGGAGQDTLDGGTAVGSNGADTYLFSRGDGQDTLYDSDTMAGIIDVIRFGADVAPDDVVIGQTATDRVFSIVGTSDSLTVLNWYGGLSERIERVEFADGTVWDSAYLAFANIDGTENADSLVGTSDQDNIRGLGGNDYLSGDAGNDTLDGGAGNDALYGGDGGDVLLGGAGDDSLFGGDDAGTQAGADVFVFGLGDGHDVVSDQGTAGDIDTIRFAGSLAPQDISIYQRDNNLIFQIISSGETLTVLNGQWDTSFRVERIEFGNGAIWDATQLSFAIVGNELGNIENGTALDDVATTFGGVDYIETYAGNDYLDGGAGDDTLIGGQGNDVYIVDTEFDVLTELSAQGTDEVRSTLSWTLATNFENLQLLGADNIDGTGNSVTNVINGNAGDNLIDGKAGADTLAGGTGNDTYVVDNAGDVVSENAAEGIDLVRSSVTFTLGSNIENLTLTGSGAINATGNELDNVLTGNTGNNVLTGGAGNDTYVVAQAGDSVVENAAEGIDLVQSSVTHTLQSNVENLTLTGSSALNGTGNELDNVLTGNTGVNILTGADGNDTLNGGSGADTLIGGLGDDLYIVDNTNEVVTEAAGEGTDAVNSAATYTLAANVENLTLLGTNNINGTGNASANIITGNSGANVLNGMAGADTLSGGAGNDTYVVDDVLDTVTENADEGTDLVQSSITYALGANVENATLTGSAAINATGNDLDNVLTGNSGTNTLTGGLGNDTYVVNGTADSVVENASEGTDLVQSSVTYTLSANVENITLTGASAISATGNSLDNVLTGNGAVNTLTGGQGNDTLNGGVGADILVGGAGDDLYIVDDTNETITEAAGEGIDSVESSVTYTLAAQVEQLTLTGTAAINATGNALDNVLIGNSGINTLSGGTGADTMSGGLGNDTYVVDSIGDIVIEGAAAGTDTVQSSISYTAGANVENVTLTGSTAIDATGNELNNTLRANTGNNVLTGGLGNDTYVVNSTSGDTVIENAGEGTDTVQSSVTYTLASNVENLTLTGSGTINATGNELDNVLTGNTGANNLTGAGGNDMLDGGTGNDTMAGGIGDDIYVVEVAGDVVNEAVGEGTDTVQASLTYTAAANVENVVLTGTTAINATGNGLNNTLTGNSAANTLNGGAGIDTLVGGADNDIYVVDDSSDAVIENAAEGTDTVQSTVSYVLSANVERLTLTGAAAVDATGNELDNLITGNSAVNTLSGGLGNDTYVVGSGDMIVENNGEGTDLVQSSITFSLASNVENLTLTASAAIDGTGNEIDNVLTGNTGVNVLSGGDGNDTLNGGTGADTLIGGAGNDTFVVEIAGDTVSENAAEGTDLVQSSVTYTLSANVENLTLTGSAAINATGNDLDNVLIGNTGVNTLTGGQGNDTLNGGTGADVMVGGVGDDTYTVDNAGDTITENAAEGIDHVYSSLAYTLGSTLENLTLTGSSAINGTGNALDNILAGNTGTNTLTGGLGNDTYIVNNTADVAAENAAEGTDAVFSSVTFTLGANVENLTLTGTGAINATGNELDNVLTGNTGNNTLNGGIGSDTMSGDAGNDTYVVDAAGDVAIEGEGAGTDTVQSAVTFTLAANVENLTLTGSAAVDGTGNGLDNMLTGNSGINTLTGGAGNDTLNGGSGNDTMLGGSGDDTYVVAQSGDVVTELDGEGTDLVQSSATHTLSSFVENLTLTGASNVNATGNALDNLLFGNTGNNTLTGHAGNDTLDGGSGTDTMVGGDGDDTYYSDVSGEVITEVANQGLDRVVSSATQTLAANVEMLFLTGASQINGTGNTSSNLLCGNDVRNVFSGGGGIDILEGAGGNDSLSNTGGGLFNGGLGNDSMSGGAGHDLYIGGTGSDTVTTGTGRDIIVFNLGDGADTVSSSTTQDNTLSIGGGATYADLLFERTGNNLVLRVGATDQITLTNYYASTSNRSLDTLQIIIEGTSDYDANSSNAMNNKKVESFDFDALVADFDAARAADPMLTSWSLTNSLLTRHLGGSDTEALGGDLAYQYGRFGSLADISYVPALGILAAGTFGQSGQALQSAGALQDSSPRLS